MSEANCGRRAPWTRTRNSLALIAGCGPDGADRHRYCQLVAHDPGRSPYRTTPSQGRRRESVAPQPESLHDSLLQLKKSGVSAKELTLWLGRLDVEPLPAGWSPLRERAAPGLTPLFFRHTAARARLTREACVSESRIRYENLRQGI